VHVWNVSKTKSKSVARGRQTTRGYSVYSVLLVLTRGRHLSLCQRLIGCIYRTFSIPPSHLASSFGVTPFEFMEKLYGFWNYSLPSSRRWKFGDPSLHCFWLIHPCDGRTDKRTELRWLRRATAEAAVAYKNWLVILRCRWVDKLNISRHLIDVSLDNNYLHLFRYLPLS